MVCTTIFYKVDLGHGYHLVPVYAEDVLKITVITPFWLFEIMCMAFSAKRAAQTFQRLIDSMLHNGFVFVYLNDILGLLGSWVIAFCCKVPLSSKVQAVEEFPCPVSVNALRKFLGMVHFL